MHPNNLGKYIDLRLGLLRCLSDLRCSFPFGYTRRVYRILQHAIVWLKLTNFQYIFYHFPAFEASFLSPQMQCLIPFWTDTRKEKNAWYLTKNCLKKHKLWLRNVGRQALKLQTWRQVISISTAQICLKPVLITLDYRLKLKITTW